MKPFQHFFLLELPPLSGSLHPSFSFFVVAALFHFLLLEGDDLVEDMLLLNFPVVPLLLGEEGLVGIRFEAGPFGQMRQFDLLEKD